MYDKGISEKAIREKAKDFQHMSNLVYPYFKAEGIELNFSNHNAILTEYLYCDNYDLATLHKLNKEFNLWLSYLGDIVGVAEKVYLKYENMYLYYTGFNNLLPKHQERADEITLIYNRLKLYVKLINIEYKMFKKCSFNIANMYNEGMSNFIYRT